MIYILTEEPYRDNGWIVGVYNQLSVALEKLQLMPDPTNINCNDYKLTEWDMATNKKLRCWEMTGTQFSDGVGGWNPIRKDFKFHEPTEG